MQACIRTESEATLRLKGYKTAEEEKTPDFTYMAQM